MKKKKTVKATPKKKVAPKKTKTIKQKPGRVESTKRLEAAGSGGLNFQQFLADAVNRLLDIAKAQLYDAFKQYVNGMIARGLPATLEEFLATFSNVFAVHGVTEEELVNSLSPESKEYLMNSAKLIESGGKTKVTTSKNGVKVQSEQASKVGVVDSGISTQTVAAIKEAAPAEEPSVFSDLDLL